MEVLYQLSYPGRSAGTDSRLWGVILEIIDGSVGRGVP
jgi:hypothetical protein